MLSSPVSAFKIILSLANTVSEESSIITLTAERDGLCLGIIQWLKVQLFKDIEYENNPCTTYSHWPTPVHVFEKPILMTAGQSVQIKAVLFEDEVWFHLLE